ncbi:hypothetical protein ACQPRD_003777 [Yersinia enterocolitica]
MMDITKSQSDFEAWWNAPEQAELRNSCAMGWGFRIWKAARESIEVELPTRNADAYTERDWDGNHAGRSRNNTLDECVEALRTAGIRIKGESE